MDEKKPSVEMRLTVDGRPQADFPQIVREVPYDTRVQLSRSFVGDVGTPLSQISMISGSPANLGKPTPRLLDLVKRCVASVDGQGLEVFAGRTSPETRYFDVWPGEHYRLLAALTEIMRPKVVLEFGTFTGMSSLTIASKLPPGSTVHTFDIIPWNRFRETWLTEEDFQSGRIVQHIVDMGSPEVFERHGDLIASADLVFIDGPKDVKTEQRFLERLERVTFRNDPIMLFDDIRVINMINIWEALARPKMDVTSFGHWSGTGIVDWCGTV